MLLFDLCRSGEYTPDLFAAEQSAVAERVMGVMEAINTRWGKARCPRQLPPRPTGACGGS